jgi:uncharacterized protein YceH (UPF0502 family)
MHPLDPTEIRVLGSLLEKELTTPEYYPLTLNALTAACNQKSNREPVMELSEADIAPALERLQQEKLVWRIVGGRATRWQHTLDSTWHLDRGAKAVLGLLFLRGPQTAGEIRSRAERMARFEAIHEVESLLGVLAAREEPMVREIARRPGQKESRWAHLLGGAIGEPASPSNEEREAAAEPLSVRVQRLEEQVATLSSDLRRLKDTLGEE